MQRQQKILFSWIFFAIKNYIQKNLLGKIVNYTKS